VVGNYFSVSLRGNDKVDLSLLSQQFGGGGHPNASGIKSANLGFITFESTSK
jgi:oligoribonuclease NrnB/cAMP/cGMP phosphodiesterase (DHH superfamily)